jgi:hypothetical protein
MGIEAVLRWNEELTSRHPRRIQERFPIRLEGLSERFWPRFNHEEHAGTQGAMFPLGQT